MTRVSMVPLADCNLRPSCSLRAVLSGGSTVSGASPGAHSIWRSKLPLRSVWSSTGRPARRRSAAARSVMDVFEAFMSPLSARQYRGAARNFLIYLGEDHPAVRSLNQLHRDPHILGWFAHLRSHAPPLAQAVYVCRLLFLRSILEELAR